MDMQIILTSGDGIIQFLSKFLDILSNRYYANKRYVWYGRYVSLLKEIVFFLIIKF